MNFLALAIAAICSVLAAVLAGVITQAVVEPSHPVRRYLIPVGVGAVTFAAATIIATNLVGGSPTAPVADPGNGAAAQQSAAPSAAAEPTAVPDTNEPMATSLLDLNYVEENVNRDIDLREKDSIDIGGSTYGRVLTYSCNLYCNGDSPQTRTFILGGRFSTFTADLAVLDTAAGTYRVDITLDGSEPQVFTVEAGKPSEVSLPVGGVQRMRVQLYAPGELKSPVQAGVDTTQGENGGGLPGIGLADPLLVP